MSWPSKGRPAFHKCPAPQAFPEKKKKNHPLKKIHVAVEISAVTSPGCAKPQPPNGSSLMPRPRSQRVSGDLASSLGSICCQEKPTWEILGLWPWGGSDVRVRGQTLRLPSPLFLYAGIFLKLPRYFSRASWECGSWVPLTRLHAQKRSVRPREVKGLA